MMRIYFLNLAFNFGVTHFPKFNIPKSAKYFNKKDNYSILFLCISQPLLSAPCAEGAPSGRSPGLGRAVHHLARSRPLAYIVPMDFDWDDPKSDACLAERGFDFAYAAQVFLDPGRLIEIDGRFDYGEARYRVLGRIEGRVFVVVYTIRGELFRIISARKANRREIRHYEASSRDTDA